MDVPEPLGLGHYECEEGGIFRFLVCPESGLVDSQGQEMPAATFFLIQSPHPFFFVEKHNKTQILITFISMNTYVHPTHISIYERLSRLDLKIHEVGHQERLAIDWDVTSY
jgi:hypothetical protein